jgi:hypothetical protein
MIVSGRAGASATNESNPAPDARVAVRIFSQEFVLRGSGGC